MNTDNSTQRAVYIGLNTGEPICYGQTGTYTPIKGSSNVKFTPDGDLNSDSFTVNKHFIWRDVDGYSNFIWL